MESDRQEVLGERFDEDAFRVRMECMGSAFYGACGSVPSGGGADAGTDAGTDSGADATADASGDGATDTGSTTPQLPDGVCEAIDECGVSLGGYDCADAQAFVDDCAPSTPETVLFPALQYCVTLGPCSLQRECMNSAFYEDCNGFP